MNTTALRPTIEEALYSQIAQISGNLATRYYLLTGERKKQATYYLHRHMRACKNIETKPDKDAIKEILEDAEAA